MKALLKILSLVLYYSGLYALLNRLFGTKGIYILFYHHIKADTSCFERQIKYFATEYQVISMDTAENILKSGKKIGKKYLVITFDDGYRDNLSNGLQLFRTYALKPVIYLTAANIDKQFFIWHDLIEQIVFSSKTGRVRINFRGIYRDANISSNRRKAKFAVYLKDLIKCHDEDFKHSFIDYLAEVLHVDKEPQCDLMLTWEDCRKLQAAGVTIGGHTMNHAIMKNMPDNIITGEIRDCKLLIEKRLNTEVRHFAYPNGLKEYYCSFAVNEVSIYYKTAVTTNPGINQPGADIFELKRIGISCDTNLIYIKIKILFLSIYNAKKNLQCKFFALILPQVLSRKLIHFIVKFFRY